MSIKTHKDELLSRVLSLMVKHEKVSPALVQMKLHINFDLARDLIDKAKKHNSIAT